jgi:hypothetical protein
MYMCYKTAPTAAGPTAIDTATAAAAAVTAAGVIPGECLMLLLFVRYKPGACRSRTHTLSTSLSAEGRK